MTPNHAEFWVHNMDKIRQDCIDTPVHEYMQLLPDQPKTFEPSATLVVSDAGRQASTSMASELAPIGDGSVASQPDRTTTSASYTKDTLYDKETYEFSSKGQSCTKAHSKGIDHSSTVPTPAHQEVRKSPRVLRPVPRVPDQVEVEPNSPRMGALRRGIQFLTVATALLSNCLGRFLEPAGGAAAFDLHDLEYAHSVPISTTGSCSLERSSTQAPSSAYDPIEPGRRPGELRPPGPNSKSMEAARDTTESTPRRVRGGQLRLGRLKRLSGNIERSARILQVEHQIYDDLPVAKDVTKVDIMEMYAGNAEISNLAHRYDLRAIQPFDLRYGQNLLEKGSRDLATSPTQIPTIGDDH